MEKRAVSRDKGAEVTDAAIACWNLILMPEEQKKKKQTSETLTPGARRD